MEYHKSFDVISILRSKFNYNKINLIYFFLLTLIIDIHKHPDYYNIKKAKF